MDPATHEIAGLYSGLQDHADIVSMICAIAALLFGSGWLRQARGVDDDEQGAIPPGRAARVKYLLLGMTLGLGVIALGTGVWSQRGGDPEPQPDNPKIASQDPAEVFASADLTPRRVTLSGTAPVEVEDWGVVVSASYGELMGESFAEVSVQIPDGGAGVFPAHGAAREQRVEGDTWAYFVRVRSVSMTERRIEVQLRRVQSEAKP